MKNKQYSFLRSSLFVLLLGIGCLIPAKAGFVVGATGSWQPFPTILTEDDTLYFDNLSKDGANGGVAHFLRGTSPYSGSPNVTPDFWGNADGSADLSFYFQNGGLPMGAELLLEVAGFKNVNELGWYDRSQVNPSLVPIFAGLAGPGATLSFTPTATFGLYLKNDRATYFSESQRNAASEISHQHFVVFRGDDVSNPNSFWIGVEDLHFGALNGYEGQGDFNDMVVKLTVPAAETPEPGSLILMGGGLLGIATLLRRKASQRQS